MIQMSLLLLLLYQVNTRSCDLIGDTFMIIFMIFIVIIFRIVTFNIPEL